MWKGGLRCNSGAVWLASSAQRSQTHYAPLVQAEQPVPGYHGQLPSPLSAGSRLAGLQLRHSIVAGTLQLVKGGRPLRAPADRGLGQVRHTSTQLQTCTHASACCWTHDGSCMVAPSCRHQQQEGARPWCSTPVSSCRQAHEPVHFCAACYPTQAEAWSGRAGAWCFTEGATAPGRARAVSRLQLVHDVGHLLYAAASCIGGAAC